MPTALPESVRFWRHVDKTPFHWLWTGGKHGDGYGVFRVGSTVDGTRRMVLAHVWSYLQEHDEIINELDHLPFCRVRNCIRSSHLEDVTHQVNILRGKTIAATHAAKVVCGICGADYLPDRRPNGQRLCSNVESHPNTIAARLRSTAKRKASQRTCTVPGCNNTLLARGWCSTHYKQWWVAHH